jgi:hypothetical protein
MGYEENASVLGVDVFGGGGGAGHNGAAYLGGDFELRFHDGWGLQRYGDEELSAAI